LSFFTHKDGDASDPDCNNIVCRKANNSQSHPRKLII
jgi:hypothetical protein